MVELRPDRRPDWWVVRVQPLPPDGSLVRMAFRTRPTVECWVPGLEPSETDLDRLGALLLEHAPTAPGPQAQDVGDIGP